MEREVSAAMSPVHVSAHVVYLRPIERMRLLGALARLGVFVHEVPAGVGGCDLAPPRFSIVVTDKGDTCQAATTVPLPVIAVVPRAGDEAAFTCAGIPVVNEDMSDDELTRAIAAVARRARDEATRLEEAQP